MVRILVIDDDQHMRRACERVLMNAGATVQCAGTGEEGYKIFADAVEKFDVILIDRLMPGRMNGMDVLTKVHALDSTLPVIIMTGSATEESISEAVQAGAFDCLAKPFTPEQLREVIRKAAKIESFE